MSGATTAVVLLSGGMDSATVLALAHARGLRCYTLSFDYGQRHHVELRAAERLAKLFCAVEHRVFSVDLASFGGSALTDPQIPLDDADISADAQDSAEIPPSYVPARNTVFLSIALAWAETLGADEIHLGVNAVDYSGYPDCRPEYIAAFSQMADMATRTGVQGAGIRIHAPLLHWSKVEIIRCGHALDIDYSLTTSCYRADLHGHACGSCASCVLRREAFLKSGVADPTLYQQADSSTEVSR